MRIPKPGAPNRPRVEWSARELAAFKPPERLTVSQWADRYRQLDIKSSSEHGQWHTSRVPYTRAVMDAWNDPGIRHIILCFGAQSAKTETLFNDAGYAIHQDPGPMLIVYPSDDLAESISENRLEPMILSSPVLAERYNKRASDKLELQFDNMFVALGGANSPSKLASRPIRYLLRDEIDKFPKWSGQEANPLSLSEERTKTFPNCKIVDASTPTLKSGPIWQMLETADRLMRYEIPCPHCGKFQTLKFQQIKFPEEQPGWDIRRRSDAAIYECEHCKGLIDDMQKVRALVHGRWVVEREIEGRVESVAFHISSLYSPWVTWAQVAHKFLSSKDAPELLMNFINSWLAEPWEDKANRMKSDVVMSMKAEHPRGRVPDDAQLLTCGVDVQKDHFWWAVRAWGPDMISWNVDYGRAETWAQIDEIIERQYPKMSGEAIQITLAGIDSGFNADEVYEFCVGRQDHCLPTKGSSTPLRARYQISTIEKGVATGLRLYILDPSQFKDFIAGRLKRPPNTPGAWMVPSDVDRLYCDHICAEQKVLITDRRGRSREEWQLISSHAANHLLDAECIAAAMAEVIGVRYLRKPGPKPEKENKQPEGGGFIPRREGWLRRD